MCVELMLNAVNLAFVAFSRALGTLDGQVLVFFVLTVAAAEAAVGLAIVIAAPPAPGHAGRGRLQPDEVVGMQGLEPGRSVENAARDRAVPGAAAAAGRLRRARPVRRLRSSATSEERGRRRPGLRHGASPRSLLAVWSVLQPARRWASSRSTCASRSRSLGCRLRPAALPLRVDRGRAASAIPFSLLLDPLSARDDPGRDRHRLADPHLLARLHGPRRGARPLLLVPEPLHVLHAAAGPGRQPAADVRGLGGRRALLVPADRVLVQEEERLRRGQEGVHREPHRRRGPDPRA